MSAKSKRGAAAQRRSTPRGERRDTNVEPGPQFTEYKPKVDRSPIAPITENQKRYFNAIKSFPLVIASGPAGTGKTFLSTAYAARMIEEGEVEKLIITRPAVEAGEDLGALPGEIQDKFGPYLAPYRETLDERLGKSFVDYLIKVGRIEATPLAYLRGRTFKNCIVLLDEAQNTTPKQMKMFLTRIGQNCKMIVNGDSKQSDISGRDGLSDAIERLSYIPSVKHIKFNLSDVVRSELCGEIAQAYEEGPLPPV